MFLGTGLVLSQIYGFLWSGLVSDFQYAWCKCQGMFLTLLLSLISFNFGLSPNFHDLCTMCCFFISWDWINSFSQFTAPKIVKFVIGHRPWVLYVLSKSGEGSLKGLFSRDEFVERGISAAISGFWASCSFFGTGLVSILLHRLFELGTGQRKEEKERKK